MLFIKLEKGGKEDDELHGEEKEEEDIKCWQLQRLQIDDPSNEFQRKHTPEKMPFEMHAFSSQPARPIAQ